MSEAIAVTNTISKGPAAIGPAGLIDTTGGSAQLVVTSKTKIRVRRKLQLKSIMNNLVSISTNKLDTMVI